MKHLLFILFLLSSFNAFSQVEDGCIVIDFETFPNTEAIDGMTLSDQYKESFGLSFRLEGGGFPVLAQRGGVMTAFGSIAGNDSAYPEAESGDFFLTDDGLVNSTFAPPVILEFEIPIDSFAGCILDLDFDEEFTISAFDEFGNVLLSETLYSDGTGDGLATCWGFNLAGCEGSVYSIKYEGFRPTGLFGLGLDNFSFCYSGLHIGTDKINATCNFPGQITIFSTTIETYQYSLDGISFSDNGTFTDLEAGVYNIFVRDSDGCEVSVPFELYSESVQIDNILTLETTCGENNGAIEIITNPATGNTYSLDGVNFQTSNLFTDLPPDDYIIVVEDQDGCIVFSEAVIEPSESPTINNNLILPDECNQNTGSIQLEATGGLGQLLYSIDNINFEEPSFFENLSGGDYTFYVTDELNCSNQIDVIIPLTPEVILENIELTNAICQEENGSINIVASGGEGQLLYSLNGSVFQANPTYENLPAGNYNIQIIDINNCMASADIDIESPPQSFIDNVDLLNTSCNENNGTFTVNVTPSNGVMYSIDGNLFQDSNIFSDLIPGDYTITIVDPNGCISEITQTIAPSVEPQINNIDLIIEECQLANGSFTIQASGGTGELNYSIDGINFNQENAFIELSEGEYMAYVSDEMGCVIQQAIFLPGTPIIELGYIEVTTPDCFNNTGVIEANFTGGTGNINISIDGGPLQSAAVFDNLAPGEHEIFLIDDLGCETRQIINVPIPPCPIYIPNVFSPNNDNNNDIFQVYTNLRYDAGILTYNIYDRWGELVYTAEKFSIHGNKKLWWDGYFNNAPAEIGVYTYLIEVLHPTGLNEYFAGDITLLR